MFKTQAEQARFAARIGFGVGLIGGAIALVACVLSATFERRGDSLVAVLRTAWLAAFVTGVAVRVGAQHLPLLASERARTNLFVASYVVPAIGLALTLPLTLHALWWWIGDAHDFDDWAAIAMVLTGVSHLIFATLLALRAADVARGKPQPLSVPVVYVSTVVGGMLPFPILPSAIIAITGLPILPLLILMRPFADRERRRLLAPALPTAIAAAA